jgi:hypothetical protein
MICLSYIGYQLYQITLPAAIAGIIAVLSGRSMSSSLFMRVNLREYWMSLCAHEQLVELLSPNLQHVEWNSRGSTGPIA